MKLIYEKCITVLDKHKYLIKSFYILVFLYIILYFPIIRADYEYADDILRKLGEGQTLWVDCYGAYLAQLLGIALAGGTLLIDYSPLGQIVSSVFLALSGVILIFIFSSKRRLSFNDILSVLAIGLTPNFLECISYKYDSALFGMSIFFAVFPLIFYKTKKYIYVIMSILSLLCSFLSYHASSGMYIVLVIFLSLYSYIKGCEIKSIFVFIFKSAFSYTIAIIFFYFSLTFIEFSEAALGSISDQLSIFAVLNNLYNIYSYFFMTWNTYYKVVFLLLLFTFIFLLCFDSKRNRIISFFIIIVSLGFVFIFQFGISQIFIKQVNISERYYIGSGITISVIILLCNEFLQKYKKVSIISIFFILGLVSSTLKYGNCLYNNKLYTYNRVYPIINDLNKIISKYKNYELGIVSKDGEHFNNNFGESKDPCFNVLRPLISECEPRLFNYYFTNKKINTIPIQQDSYGNLSLYEYESGFNVVNENKSYAIETDGNKKIQIILK